ncbi:MAG: diguanylate cyclase [Bacillota bacterium]|nr:diguanylate cyclase [Bacillota bacterium]
MQKWLKKREEKLAELMSGAHVLAYLIAVAIFIVSDPRKYDNLYTFSVLLIAILIPAALFIALDSYFLQNKNGQDKNTILAWNITKHAVLFAMITTVFSAYRSEYLWLIGALYLLPVVLSCITLVRWWGMAFAGASAGSIFILSRSIDFTAGNQAVEAALILGGIFFLLAWFLGGIMEVEKGTTARLVSLVNEDSLTGLGNHRYFHEQLNQAVEKAQKEQTALSLVLLDIDFFKLYNETYGHSQGDLFLQEMGNLLKEHAPPNAILARYSGDVFGVILPTTDLQEANSAAYRVNNAVANYVFPGEIRQPFEKITVSAGVANYPYHSQNAQELLNAADEALYSSKSTGRNKVRIYHAIIERLIRTAGDNDRELINSLRTLMTVVNGKDRYTYGHSERVSYYTKNVGKMLGIGSQELRQLEFGAFLHDIGKLEIPHEVLNKNGPLSQSEWEMVKQHPAWGSEILKPISLLQDAIPMVLHHHENYDGSGYPDGLKGKKIPLSARILRVVDSFDAITTIRPYRRSLSMEEALKEILRCSGLYYDPLVVDIFVKYIREEQHGDR